MMPFKFTFLGTDSLSSKTGFLYTIPMSTLGHIIFVILALMKNLPCHQLK